MAELLPYQLDLFHSPDFIPPQWGGNRQIVTVHDLNFIYYPEFLTAESQRYYADQIAWAFERADHILADSNHTRNDLITRLNVPAEKVTTVHLAANQLYSQSYSDEEINQTLAGFHLPKEFILFVGTLEPRKNIPLLLKAYKQLIDETKVDIPLVLVGRRGWLFEEIFTSIEALGLFDKVHQLNQVSDRQLAHLYSAAGLLALPSYYEGFGLPPLEAMHCGCPVIVSDRGSLPEIVGEAGIILPPEEPEVWASAMRAVLTDDQKRKNLQIAGLKQAQKFTWEKAANKTLEIYDKVS